MWPSWPGKGLMSVCLNLILEGTVLHTGEENKCKLRSCLERYQCNEESPRNPLSLHSECHSLSTAGPVEAGLLGSVPLCGGSGGAWGELLKDLHGVGSSLGIQQRREGHFQQGRLSVKTPRGLKKHSPQETGTCPILQGPQRSGQPHHLFFLKNQ